MSVEKTQNKINQLFKPKVQVGYNSPTVNQRKEGEEWTDARGRTWKIENKQRKQITKIPPRGFDKCLDCNKLILKKMDQDTWNRMARCYYCQVNFEAHLKTINKWGEWVNEQEQARWKSVTEELTDALRSESERLPDFDPTLANAITNEHKNGAK